MSFLKKTTLTTPANTVDVETWIQSLPADTLAPWPQCAGKTPYDIYLDRMENPTTPPGMITSSVQSETTNSDGSVTKVDIQEWESAETYINHSKQKYTTDGLGPDIKYNTEYWTFEEGVAYSLNPMPYLFKKYYEDHNILETIEWL
jgi:hypothetical protein